VHSLQQSQSEPDSQRSWDDPRLETQRADLA
jgi:hypothetical protein